MVPGQRQTLPFLFPKPKLAKGAQVRPPSHLAALASLPHCGSIDELPGLPHSLAKALNPALQPLHFAPAKTPTDQDLTSLGTFFKKFSCSSQPHANTCFSLLFLLKILCQAAARCPGQPHLYLLQLLVDGLQPQLAKPTSTKASLHAFFSQGSRLALPDALSPPPSLSS